MTIVGLSINVNRIKEGRHGGYVVVLSPRPVRHANASRGVSLRQHSIILCTFAYKFISNLHQLNEIASSTAPLYKSRHYRMRTPLQGVLLSFYLYPFSLEPSYTLIHINTTHKSLAFLFSPNNEGAVTRD